MSEKLTAKLCVRCKGVKLLCHKLVCPIFIRLESSKLIFSKITGRTLSGATPPEVFVGSKFWPKVAIGPLISPIEPENITSYSNPEFLIKKSLLEVIELRSRLIRSVFRLEVKEARKPNKLLELTRELGASSLPVDAEVKFKRLLKPTLKFDEILAPSGPSASIEELKVIGNPSIPRKAENLITDYDVPVTTAIKELYDSGESNYYISRLLSIGLLGRKKDRLLVPTRWSITATDAIISEHLAEKISEFDELGEVLVYSYSYSGNYYEIALLPGPLSYELIEIWHPGSIYVPEGSGAYCDSDHETFKGKKEVSTLGGGYYAMKLPIYEHLFRIKRQAFAFSIREVTPEYFAPVGSWKMREALRIAFRKEPKKFDDVEEAIKDISSRIRLPFDEWFRKARLLRTYLVQRRIEEYLKL